MVGFGAHNATEGFGIVAPLAGGGERPSWLRLFLLGLIGGGPTFLGTLTGEQFTTPFLGVAFLSLAAGSILYVVIELLAVARAAKLKVITTWAILFGLTLGFATDAIVTAAAPDRPSPHPSPGPPETYPCARVAGRHGIHGMAPLLRTCPSGVGGSCGDSGLPLRSRFTYPPPLTPGS